MSDSAEQLMERLRAGDIRALGRAITEVESRSALGQSLLAACYPYSGSALRIGITGPPGAGKSTLVDRLISYFRSEAKTVGVIAVDPTSPFSGGAILGDRIRMQSHHADAGVYARSMATRGALGGLASATADVASLVAASGKDVILIETVGVGQDEVAIVELADTSIVVLVPGMGDDVQSIKAGILEIADIFVINKSDREGAERLEQELCAMQGLNSFSKDADRLVPIIKTVATEGEGIAELAAEIRRYEGWLANQGRLTARRRLQWRARIVEMLRQELFQEMQRLGWDEVELSKLAQEVAVGATNPYQALPEWVERIRHSEEIQRG